MGGLTKNYRYYQQQAFFVLVLLCIYLTMSRFFYEFYISDLLKTETRKFTSIIEEKQELLEGLKNQEDEIIINYDKKTQVIEWIYSSFLANFQHSLAQKSVNLRELLNSIQMPLPESTGIFISRRNSSHVLKAGLDFADFFGENWETQAFLALSQKGNIFSSKITIYKYPMEYDNFMSWNGEFQTLRLPKGFVHRFFLDNGRYTFFLLFDLQKISRIELEKEILDRFVKRYNFLTIGSDDQLIFGQKIINFGNGNLNGLHYKAQWQAYSQWLMQQHGFNIIFLAFFIWLYYSGGYLIMATRFEFRFFVTYLFLAYLLYSSADYLWQELYYYREAELKKQLEANWSQQSANINKAFDFFQDYFTDLLKETSLQPDPFIGELFQNGNIDGAIFNYDKKELIFNRELNYIPDSAIQYLVRQTILLQTQFFANNDIGSLSPAETKLVMNKVNQVYGLDRYRRDDPAYKLIEHLSVDPNNATSGDNWDQRLMTEFHLVSRDGKENSRSLNWGKVDRFRFFSDDFLYFRFKRSEQEFLVASTLSRFFLRHFTDYLMSGLCKQNFSGSILLLQCPGVTESFRSNSPQLTERDFEHIYKELHGRADVLSQVNIADIDYYVSILKNDILTGYYLLFLEPKNNLDKDLQELNQKRSSFQLLFFFCSTLLAVALQRLIMTRVGSLMQGFRYIKKSDYSFRLPDRGYDESATVVKMFNNMVNDLETKRKLMPFVPDIILSLFRQKKKTDLAMSGLAVVVFSDIRNFTTISETEDPADVVEMLNSYFTIWQEKVEKYGGVVERFIGDAISVVFFHEASVHYLHNALQTAIEVYEDLQKLNTQRRQKGEFEIKNGTGIAAGSVSFGIIGNEQKREFMLAGEPVTLAEKMETASKQGQGTCIIVCEQVYEALQYSYDFIPFLGLEKNGRLFFELSL